MEKLPKNVVIYATIFLESLDVWPGTETNKHTCHKWIDSYLCNRKEGRRLYIVTVGRATLCGFEINS